mgnify:CR=1 FL=1
MIKEIKALSMLEANEIAGKKGRGEGLDKFIKKFGKSEESDFKKLKNELEGLEILKLKSEHIAKIIDIMPKTAVDLNKIVFDVGFDEKETNAVLETVKKYI